MGRIALVITFLGLTLALAVSVFFNVALTSKQLDGLGAALGGSSVPRFREAVYRPAGEKADEGRVVMIPLRGIISESESGVVSDNMVFDLIHAFRQADEDPTVKAVVIRMDSPGGEVTASNLIYSQIKALRAKKPVVISMGASGASGAYFAACGGSFIIADETTTTGSIGVIVSMMNYRELLGKVGLRPQVFKSGHYKDILSGSREMTQTERDYIDIMVMQAFDSFTTVVAQERKIPIVTLKEKVGDGRIISGRDALTLKLVDMNGNLEDAITKASELAGLEKPEVIQYVPPRTLFAGLPGFLSSQNASMDLNVHLLPQSRIEAGKLYLLPDFLFY